MYAEIGDAVRCDAEIGPGKVRTIVVQIFFLFPFPWNAHRFLNRQRDYKDGKNLQLYAQSVDTKLRDDIERLKKIRNHRGLRHYWCVKVRFEKEWKRELVICAPCYRIDLAVIALLILGALFSRYFHRFSELFRTDQNARNLVESIPKHSQGSERF